MDEAANGGKYVSGRSKVNEAIAADLARHVAGSEVPTGGDITGGSPQPCEAWGSPAAGAGAVQGAVRTGPGVCACAARLGSSQHHACSA